MGTALESARAASDQMGYAFRLAEVSVAEGAVTDTVDITAQVIQDGVDPFYYDLSLGLACPGFSVNIAGVDDIVSEGSSASFTFTAVPGATTTCLSSLGFSISSSYTFAGAPIKFAQGIVDGTVIEMSLPLPPPTPGTGTPSASPTQSPIKLPAVNMIAKYVCQRTDPGDVCVEGLALLGRSVNLQ